MKLPVVVDTSAAAIVALLAATVSTPSPSAIMSTLAPMAKSVLAFIVTTVAEPLVNLIVLPESAVAMVLAVVASVTKVARSGALVARSACSVAVEARITR